MRNRFMGIASLILVTACAQSVRAGDVVVKQMVDPTTGQTVVFTRSTAPFKEYRYGTLRITTVDSSGKTTTKVYRHFDVLAARQAGIVRFATKTEFAQGVKTHVAFAADDDCSGGDESDGMNSSSGGLDDCYDSGGDNGGGSDGDGGSDGNNGGSNDGGTQDPPPTVSNPNPTNVPTPPANPAELGQITVTANTSSVSQTVVFASDGYNWSITYTWTRAVTDLGGGKWADGPWSAPVATAPKKICQPGQKCN